MLNIMMCTPCQILFRLSRQGGLVNVAGSDKKRNSYRVVVGKPERKKRHLRHRYRLG